MIPGLHIDWSSSTPVYQQIVDSIREAACQGRLTPPHRLPPTRELARELGVNRNTVVAAYDRLASEGWVRSHTGRGTFLVERAETSSSGEGQDSGPWFTAFSRAAEEAGTGGLQTILQLAISEEGTSFVGSYPAGDLLPVAEFGTALSSVLDERGAGVLSYGPTAGDPGLRETIAGEMIAQGSPATGDDILVTNGAQQALELVFRTLLDREDAAVVEEPTYTGALNVLGSVGARIVAVPVDGEGIRPDLLEMALERHRPRLIYLQPTFQNPTHAVMGRARRQELLALAERYRCPIVEDDWASGLRFDGEPVPSLHALDGGRHVIYLSTFSKKLMPGLRIGWVSAPGPILSRLIEMKRLQDCGTSPLLQAGLDRFLRDGGLRRHLARVVPVYRERRDRMAAALRRHFPAEARWTTPTGGLFFWVTLPESFDGDELFVAARREGVLYSRGDLFHNDGSGQNCLRLTFSAASPECIDSGIARLGGLVRERGPQGRRAAAPRTVEDMPIF